MRRRGRRRVAGDVVGVCAAAAGLALGLAACSSPMPSAPPSGPVPSASLVVPGPAPSATKSPGSLVAGAHWRGVPASFGTSVGVHAAGVARTTDDALLYVVLWGSSTCPPVAVSPATRTGAGAVAVVTDRERYGGRACTADLGPSTTVVALPDDVDPGGALTVLVDGHGPAHLPAGDDGAPAWIDVS